LARSDRGGWVEPTSLLPLRWGGYRERWIGGLVLIVAGGIHIQATNTWSLPFLLVGTLASVAGWSIMPATGGRRILAIVLAVGPVWVLLTGPQSVWALVGPFLGWLVVRHRPLPSSIAVVFPLASGVIIPQYLSEYSGMTLALSISIGVVVASAWIARLIAQSARIPSKPAGSTR